jgi:hypothetical protein
MRGFIVAHCLGYFGAMVYSRTLYLTDQNIQLVVLLFYNIKAGLIADLKYMYSIYIHLKMYNIHVVLKQRF